MNKRQRKDLAEIAEKMQELLTEVETMQEEEQEKVDNLEIEFPGHARLEALQESAEALEMAKDEIEGGLESLKEIIDG